MIYKDISTDLALLLLSVIYTKPIHLLHELLIFTRNSPTDYVGKHFLLLFTL